MAEARMAAAGSAAIPDAGAAPAANGGPVAGAGPLTESPARSAKSQGPGTWLVVALVSACAVAALWPSVSSLGAFWVAIHDYQYGFLIAAIAIAWTAVAIRPVAATAARPSVAASVVLASMLLGWLVAFGANSLILQQALLPLCLWMAAWAAAGWHAARRLWLPIGFLYFAVPLWEYALPALRWLSVLATEGLLHLMGVPAVVREYNVTIPEGTFRIVDGCSGKRYFIVALAVAVLAAAMNHFRGWRAVAFVAAGGLAALVANWVRIVAVIYAGHVTDMQHYLVSEEHITFGNAIFVVLLFSIFMLARLVAAGHPAPGKPKAPKAMFVGARRPAWLVGLPFALLTITLLLVQLREGSVAPQSTLEPLPIETARWLGPLPGDPGWHPVYVGATAEQRAAYLRGPERVEVYVNVYSEQRQDQELVFYGNSLLSPGEWTRVWPETNRPLGEDLISFEATDGAGNVWLIARCFEVSGRLRRFETTTQLTYGLEALVRPVPAGVIALASRCGENCEGARILVESFWNDVSTSIRAVVPDAPSVTSGAARFQSADDLRMVGRNP